ADSAPPPASAAPVSSPSSSAEPPAEASGDPPPTASDEAADAPRPGISHWRSNDGIGGAAEPQEHEPEKSASATDATDAGLSVRALRRGLAASRERSETERRARVSRDGPATRRSRRSERKADADELAEPPVGTPIDPTYDPLAGEVDGEARENGEVDAIAAHDDTPALEEHYFDDEEVSQFEYRAPFTARRNPAKMWTALVVLFALLAGGTAVAINYFGVPEFAPFSRPTFGIGKPELVLDFEAGQQRMDTLETGERVFRVRGTISNVARESVGVPDLLIVFRGETDEALANRVVVPAKRTLAPGETLTVTEAIADVPQAARFAEVGWAPG
ncbi:MAG: hypothetical protein RIC51_06975, partial [Erythrobacter sp.]